MCITAWYRGTVEAVGAFGVESGRPLLLQHANRKGDRQSREHDTERKHGSRGVSVVVRSKARSCQLRVERAQKNEYDGRTDEVGVEGNGVGMRAEKRKHLPQRA